MYIPKGKIDPKAYYTDGGEYFYSTTRTQYIGYYHLDYAGTAWTGKTHTVNSIKLITTVSTNPIPPNVDQTSRNSIVYNSLVKNTQNKTILSSSIPPNDSLPPTSEDYAKGFYTRYILEYKLSSKPFFIEVNKQTYFNIVNSTQKTYFKHVEVLWRISGPPNNVYENGILMQGGVIDSNIKSIEQAQKTMPGIEKYLADLTLYYIPLAF